MYEGNVGSGKGDVRRPSEVSHDEVRDRWDNIFGPKKSDAVALAESSIPDPKWQSVLVVGPPCPKCGGEMLEGKALITTLVDGMPDFIGKVTNAIIKSVYPGGSGKMVDVDKCCLCGHSVRVFKTQ